MSASHIGTLDAAVAEGHYCMGDMMFAVQTIVTHKLPLTPAGAAECERIMREFGQGNTWLWKHPEYLRTAIILAQGAVRETLIMARAGRKPGATA